jgi:outer membrane protein TolC
MEDARHQVSLMFAGLWFDWLVSAELRRNEQASAKLLEQELRALERRRDLRDASQLEVDQAQAALDQALGQAAQTAAGETQARVRLLANFTDLPLPETVPDLGQPELPEQALEDLRGLVISRSHEILAADREAARLDVVARRTDKDRMADPSVGVRVFSERSGMERGAGLVFQMPLGGGYRKAQAQQASAEAHAATFDLASVRRMVEATADADLADVRSRMETWQRFASAVRSAGQAAERSAIGYRLGATDLADLLLIRRQHHDARRMEIMARGDALRALLKLQIDAHVIWKDEDIDH